MPQALANIQTARPSARPDRGEFGDIGRLLPDLASPELRAHLKPRKEPYYMSLCQGRALGYRSSARGLSFWIARATTSGPRYIRHRLAFCDDFREADGVSILTFEQARLRAWEWFRTTKDSVRFSDLGPVGKQLDLNWCPIGDVYTFGHMLTDYLAWKRLGSSPAHVQSMISIVNYHLLPRLATTPADAMTPELYAWLIKDILETSVDRGTRFNGKRNPVSQMDPESARKRKITLNKVLTVLRSALRMAWENGKTSNERCWHIVRNIPNRANKRQMFLSRPECALLLKCCAPDLRVLVLGALYTGCRVTELRRTRVRDIGHDGYGVYVTSAKSYRPRFVFLPDEGMAFFLGLAKNRDPEEYVFLRANRTQWGQRYTPALKEALLRAELPFEFTFHDLRHTYASQLVQAGAPLIVVADQLGHADTQTVGRTYGHMSPQIRESEVRQRFSRLSEIFAAQAFRQKRKLMELRRSLHGNYLRAHSAGVPKQAKKQSKSRTGPRELGDNRR
jgi:integrase/recombinase XerD